MLIVKQNLPTVFGVSANDTALRDLILFGTSFLIMLPLSILRVRNREISLSDLNA